MVTGPGYPEGELQFGLLGPVQVWRGDREVDLGSGRQRAVLACLLMPSGQPHSTSEIIDAVWGAALPGHPRNLVHKYVGGLRRTLEPTAGPSRTSDILPLTGDGYTLNANPDAVDLQMFTQAVSSGLALLDTGLEIARDRLRTALELWRGTAFGQLSSEFFDVERRRLAECRLAALEDRISIDLALGRHTAVTAELVGLISENPLHEHLPALLMIALYGAGRQADALAVFHDCRQRLVTEIGIEPGEELRRLHAQILASDRICDIPLSRGDSVTPIPQSVTVVPAAYRPAANPSQDSPPQTLPSASHQFLIKPDIGDFVGREAEIARVRAVLADATVASPIVVITGMAGVGKSTLAMRIANLMTSSFPAGQLHLNFRGMSAGPVEPTEALVRLLRALQVPDVDRASTDHELSEMYRTALPAAVLAVFDDVSDESQVRPLLTWGTDSATLVTSRLRLAGLEGAHIVEIGSLDQDDALAMLGRIIGPQRLADDLPGAHRIVRFAEGLPLALRIAGARLAARPHWTLSQFADRLANECRRLDEFTYNDLALQASLASTFHHLGADGRDALILLGSMNEQSVTAASASFALGMAEDVTEDILDRLADLHLVQAHGSERGGRPRYQMTGLVRTFARGLAQPGRRRRRPTPARSPGQVQPGITRGFVARRQRPA